MSNPPRPIADHGLIGDLRTAALVATDGTIDWYCAPRFDSPSVFAALLDDRGSGEGGSGDGGSGEGGSGDRGSDDRAGSWRIEPVDGRVRSHQFYFPDSNILITRFLTEAGVVEVHDFMPIMKAKDPDHRQRLVRRIAGVRGDLRLTMRLAARPDYGRQEPACESVDTGVLITAGDLRLGLSATVELSIDGPDVTATFDVSGGDTALFVLETLPAEGVPDPADVADNDRLFDSTTAFWRSWLAQSRYTGRWRETVHRSALTLKLLCHEPSGAIIAAPTTSLPEVIGGGRNWDYRYVWIRDAAFSLYALLHLGFLDEAADFMRWLSERLGDRRDGDLGPLRVLYDIDGNNPVDEQELDHLAGYAGSRPVRIGNAAIDQLQLDIYGELIDSVYLFNKYGDGISYDAWHDLVRALEWLMAHWDQADAGMWEIRGETRRHTSSALMCWVAIERMIRTARQRGLPGDLSAWGEVRDRIYGWVMDHAWDAEVGAFMAYEGAETVDAGALLMPMLKFVAPNDPRFLSTLAVLEERLVNDSLVFRYDAEKTDDGVGGAGEEGTFSLCSFWYVEALTRTGRLGEARLALEKMFTYANHLGLYAEEIGLTGDQLGNFPQAFTHLALISAATNLDRRLG